LIDSGGGRYGAPVEPEILRALDAFNAVRKGAPADLPLLDMIIRGLRLGLDDARSGGSKLFIATAHMRLAAALRLRAEQGDGSTRREIYIEALEQARFGRDVAIERATQNGVTGLITTIYVMATHEAGLIATALGEMDASASGTELLAEAAAWLGEAAAGYRRLRRTHEAGKAQLMAVAARGLHALRGLQSRS
jgi:hypothetical protein